MKLYDGPAEWWLNNWGASFGYEILFMGLAFLAFPTPAWITRIAIAVCCATIGLEFLQLWHPVWLENIRVTFVGQALLGNQFSWRDLPAYPLGCLLGWLLLGRLSRRKGRYAPDTTSII
jgi:hypothetical protein